MRLAIGASSTSHYDFNCIFRVKQKGVLKTESYDDLVGIINILAKARIQCFGTAQNPLIVLKEGMGVKGVDGLVVL